MNESEDAGYRETPESSRPRRVVFGIVARGRVAVGVVALGGVSIGVIALGGVAIGVVALGGLSLGGLALGGLALGWKAIGAVAIGVSAAQGAIKLLLGAFVPPLRPRFLSRRSGAMPEVGRG